MADVTVRWADGSASTAVRTYGDIIRARKIVADLELDGDDVAGLVAVVLSAVEREQGRTLTPESFWELADAVAEVDVQGAPEPPGEQ